MAAEDQAVYVWFTLSLPRLWLGGNTYAPLQHTKTEYTLL